MTEATASSDPHSSGKVLELRPGDGTKALGKVQTARKALAQFLDSAGWSVSDLSTDQIRLLAGLMTERQKLFETIQSLSHELDLARNIADHDPLVPVYNRRAFLRELSRQLSFCQRYELSSCLIYLDLDHFKALNDTLGHSTGDEALKVFVRVLKSHTRESDLIGRLGGDEFAILLMNADQDAADTKAAQLRDDVRKLSFGESSAPLYLDVSAGVAQWQSGESAEHLVERADEAMFSEKHKRSRASA
tara:strand:- start:767 stop:1507 length:741 start_codon:yes stop_codon:yes gene_type:complete